MIRIQNIYYMLSYAFRVLKERDYRSLATEDFENTEELCAAILIRGITIQIKRGLVREYIPRAEALSTLRGKIDIPETIKIQVHQRNKIFCGYDDFSVNSYMNRIIKSTMIMLIGTKIKKEQKKELRKLLAFFNDVDTLDLQSTNWNVQYNRNNQTYRMLISICYLAVKRLLQTQKDGTTKLMDYADDLLMSWLYEKFILEYYRKEFPQIKANASQIPWQLDVGTSTMLPVMQTDVMLVYGEKTLIIDAKYYLQSMQNRYEKQTLRSGHLFQIFTYVKNKEAELSDKPHEVSGMLLYAKTDEEIHPNEEYWMSGNRIEVRTLDLDKDFDQIKSQLNGIVEKYFGIKASKK